MYLTTLLYYALAAGATVSAIPAPLSARADTIHGFPPGNWICKTSPKNDKTQTFTSGYIQASVEAALALRDNSDKKAGKGKYPEFLTGPESITGLEAYRGQRNIDHFPLNHDDKSVYTGGTPSSGARVVYQHMVEANEAVFIGVWTHAGRKDGRFEKCVKE